jgi:transcriptional regulator
MYRPPAYVIDDVAVLHAAMRERAFATIAAIAGEHVRFAYAPIVVDQDPEPFGTVRFHLARANPLAGLDGEEIRLSLLAADAYVSPDWYETKGFVPTWNYIAIEGAGHVRRLDEQALWALLVELSANAEKKLRPKVPWTLDKIAEERIAKLLSAIRGFAVPLLSLEGKFKLSQDKKVADIAGAIAGLERRGDPASLALAQAMRETNRPG